MKTLRRAPDAVRDLARLRDYLGSMNGPAAGAAERIKQAAEMRRERPELGRLVENEIRRELLALAGRSAHVRPFRTDTAAAA